MQKLLSLGTQTFSTVRETGKTLYIDKTKYICHLATKGESARIFLSRPRRFGKSLLCSTFKSLFKGEKQYFAGLYIEDKRNWEEKFPVIHISFGFGITKDPTSLQAKLRDLLRENKRRNEIDSFESETIDGQFKELIEKIHRQTGQKVVIIIDEYDKPILDMITHPELANNNRNELKNFYAVLKDADEYLRFVFITGVSKFSKVSLFSGLNNLEDISFQSEYATVCGYTLKEIIDNYGAEGYLEGVDLDKMKKRYNGYNFNCEDPACMVYNPYGLLNFFNNKNEYRNYRFESATPKFLIDMLIKHYYPVINFEQVVGGDKLFGSFDVNNLDIETLMLQTGYLTIKEQRLFGDKREYTLGIPNHEVRESLNEYIISDYLGFNSSKISKKIINVYKSMQEENPEKFVEIITSLFAGIPYSNYTNNDISRYEGFYSSVLYSFLCASGISMIFEDITNLGRIDVTLQFEQTIYIIELKVDKTGNDALTQIKEKNYQKKYLDQGSQIFLIGLNFDETIKNIASSEIETA